MYWDKKSYSKDGFKESEFMGNNFIHWNKIMTGKSISSHNFIL